MNKYLKVDLRMVEWRSTHLPGLQNKDKVHSVYESIRDHLFKINTTQEIYSR